MAPEQIEGQEADARTDIFAFGAVLYEMLTGKKAFEGKSQASLIGAILKDEPPPISRVQPVSPHSFDRALRRVLPRIRMPAGKPPATSRELRWIAEAHGVTGQRMVPTAPRVARTSGVGHRCSALLPPLLVVVASARTAGATRLSLPIPPALEPQGNGEDRPLAVSPDGRRVAYAATSGGKIRFTGGQRSDRALPLAEPKPVTTHSLRGWTVSGSSATRFLWRHLNLTTGN